MIFLPQRPNTRQPDVSRQGEAGRRRRTKKILKDVNLEELLEREGTKAPSARWDGATCSPWRNSSACPLRGCFTRSRAGGIPGRAHQCLDEPNEEHLYGLVCESGVSYVSVGHRSIPPLDDCVMIVELGGEWTNRQFVEDITPA